MIPQIADDDFIRRYETEGPQSLSRSTGLHVRAIYDRRVNMEHKYKIRIAAPTPGTRPRPYKSHPGRLEVEYPDGVVLIGSDGHYWPGEASIAHRAFVKFCKQYKPKLIIMNGDAFDGARISRWPSIMWEDRPTVQQELEAAQERLHEIEISCKAQRIWTLGNHDQRFESRLGNVAPEYARVQGVHLKDHFPNWECCWSVWINGSVVVKHRYKGGIHATHNNTVNSGLTTITGHLHSLKITPFSDYTGTRWGVDTGCLADPYGPQFADYSEDNPRNHRSGFALLTFRGGKLLWPEIISVHDKDHVDFRGELIKV